MLYNIAIETQTELHTKIVVAVNDYDLKRFVKAYEESKEFITLNGEKIIIENPVLVKIFDVTKRIDPVSVSHVRKEMQKWANIMSNGEIIIETLREHGEDVTSDFIKGEWER